MVSLLNKPIHTEPTSLTGGACETIRLCSPFIKSQIVHEIYEAKKKSENCTFMTDIRFKRLYDGATDLSALKMVLDNHDTLINLQRIHAKIYIFDERCLIITSANLTPSGLKRNFEYSITTDDKALVSGAIRDFDALCANENAGRIHEAQVCQMQNMIDSLPPVRKPKLPRLDLQYDASDDIFDKDISGIADALNGWQRAVFTVMDRHDGSVMTTRDFTPYIPELKRQYPDNNTIEAKIRQQLQELRDLGLVKFEGNGVYKKLWQS